LNIREANYADAGAISSIYNHFICHSTITFEEEPVQEEEMAQRIADVRDAELPWLVAEEGETVIGYAYVTKWRVRHAYRYSVESTIYLAPEKSGQGVGSLLYAALLDRLRSSGYHLVIGGIALPNAGSVALHEKLGFEKSAHFKEVGFKFDKWVDVGYWQLKLSRQVV
jgi:L-amino acid N-acyltransferase YncA